MRLIGAFLFLVLLGLGGYLYLGFRQPSIGAAPVATSPEAAASAEAKLDRLQLDLEEIWLTESELTSLFVYNPDIWDIGVVSSPVVRLRGDTISLSGTVDPADLPDVPGLAELRPILPDTVRVDLAGTVGPFSGADAVVEITAAAVAGLPFPSRFFPAIVARLGLPVRDGVPESAFVLRLPRGVGAARVSDSMLILSP